MCLLAEGRVLSARRSRPYRVKDMSRFSVAHIEGVGPCGVDAYVEAVGVRCGGARGGGHGLVGRAGGGEEEGGEEEGDDDGGFFHVAGLLCGMVADAKLYVIRHLFALTNL